MNLYVKQCLELVRALIRKGCDPVFWLFGITPQAVVMAAKPSLAITHAPGHMFITDIKNSALKN